MRIIRLSSIAMTAVLMTGCVVTSNTARYSTDVEAFFGYAAAGRDFKIEVLGNPFSVPTAALEKKVVDSFQRAHQHVGANFTTNPDPSANRDYKVVVFFNPGPGITIDDLCDQPVPTTVGAAGGELKVLATFCEQSPLSGLNMSIDPRPKFTDAAFGDALEDLARRLIPEDENDTKPGGSDG